jgi:hypothetical protein
MWIGIVSGATILAFVAIGAWLFAPWYSADDKAKFAALRSKYAQLDTESIDEFLAQNGSLKDFPEFKDAPVEHRTLDRLSAFGGLSGILWLVVLAVILAFKFDQAERAKKVQERERRAAIERAKPTHGEIFCRYCSVQIAEDVLYAGQNITCPHCHGAFTAPGGHGPARSKAQFDYAQRRVEVETLGVISSGFRLLAAIIRRWP